MTKAKTFTTGDIIFNVAFDGEPVELCRMRLTVEFVAGRYLVYQQDLNAEGVVWNTTPYKHFKTFEAAVEWMREEEAKSL